MAKLNTNYLGISLRNPLIVSSSGLTSSIDQIIELEKHGAGAIVLKSLFEEQIIYDIEGLENSNAEAFGLEDSILKYIKHNSVQAYLDLIKESTQSVPIPIIASVNCYSTENWIDFAKRIEQAGADALELNLFFIPVEIENTSQEYENQYCDLVHNLNRQISIPITIKLSPYFTNLPALVDQLYCRGAAGVVLFNRFYEPDIDINSLTFKSSDIFSTPTDIRTSLRWVALVSSLNKHIDVVSSTGVHNGEAVIKQLLAGAKAVQICSVLYQKGTGFIAEILNELSFWMDRKGYSSIDDFRGLLSYDKIPDPAIYERSQFMRFFSDHH